MEYMRGADARALGPLVDAVLADPTTVAGGLTQTVQGVLRGIPSDLSQLPNRDDIMQGMQVRATRKRLHERADM